MSSKKFDAFKLIRKMLRNFFYYDIEMQFCYLYREFNSFPSLRVLRKFHVNRMIIKAIGYYNVKLGYLWRGNWCLRYAGEQD